MASIPRRPPVSWPRGYSVSRLAKKTKGELSKLGLSDQQISLLRARRPPIPDLTISKLLHDSRRVCCVCRDPKLGVVIHHIEDWSDSRSHEESNLAVLCLAHHDEAHTSRGLTRGLSASEIRSHKARWAEKVQRLDAQALVGELNLDGARWHYINHGRQRVNVHDWPLRWDVLSKALLHEAGRSSARSVVDLIGSSVRLAEAYTHAVALAS